MNEWQRNWYVGVREKSAEITDGLQQNPDNVAESRLELEVRLRDVTLLSPSDNLNMTLKLLI